jgi:hypothetical protein
MDIAFKFFIVLTFLLGLTIGFSIVAKAQVGTIVSVLFNNDNLMSTPQPAPIGENWSFGSTTIIALEEGKTLIVEAYILDPEYEVNIWKYSMDQAYWYVTNKGIIYGENSVGNEPMASTSLQALSIYLTL